MTCTLFPEGNWESCCTIHGKAYLGTSKIDKLTADKTLRDCVRRAGHPLIAAIMYVGVRLLGRFKYQGLRNN